jgi:hypothetical protein
MRAEGSFPQKFLWKTKIPMKVRIFLWLMVKCSVLTKDNLMRKGWTGDPHCHFCNKTESIDHLLFSCALAKLVWQVILCAFQLVRPPENTADLFGNWIKSFPKDQRHLVMCGASAVCWVLWKTRNDVCFNRAVVSDPTITIYRLCNFLNNWAILQKNQDQGKVEEGVLKVKLVIREAYTRSHGWAPTVPRIGG